MLKKIFIFVVGTFTAVKLLGNRQNKKVKKHFYFNWNGDIYKILDNTPQWGFFLVADNDVGYEPIDFNNGIGFLARIIFCEAESEDLQCKKAVAEVIINRIASNCRTFAQQKSLKEVFYAKGQFACVTNKKFLKFYDYLDNEIELESFLGSISIAIKTLLQRNFLFPRNLLYFRSNTIKPSDTAKRYYLNCENYFWTENC